MSKFHVTGTVHASKYLGEFEADTAEEAVELALNSDAASVSICHVCSHECEDAEVVDAEASLIGDHDE